MTAAKKKKSKSKKTAAWKKTANMTPAQKRAYKAGVRKIRKQEARESAKAAKEKAAAKAAAAKESAKASAAVAATEAAPSAEAAPAKSRSAGLRYFFLYWLIFFAAIVYWEMYLGILSQGSPASMTYWFLLFAIPQSLLFAALCGWWKDRFNRVLALVLIIAVFAFYVSQFIYFRVFGSMISMSMIGVGGDAIENFGWAMMVTVKESIGLLLLFMLPVFLMIAWIFIKKPTAGRYHLSIRPIALACVVLLWLLAAAALRLGGTDEPSAYHAYVSSLVDTDTASRKLGVMTTSILELRGSSSTEDYEDEIADTFSSVVTEDQLEIPVITNPAEVPSIGKDLETDAEPEDTETADTDITEPIEATVEEPVEVTIDRSPNIIEEIDFEQLRSLTDKKAVKDLCKYFAASPGTNKNEYTGLLEGYNLIYICAESFSSMAIDEELTPTLYKMAHEGIVLTNFYNSYKNTTTNGEFSFMTGLWPDVSRQADKGVTTGSFGQSSKHLMPYGLGNIFTDMGVSSFAFHNYIGSYYGRAATHKNLGYKCKFMGDMKFTNKWITSDLEMMQQSVDDYINEDRFNVYYMTFSGHGPYDKDKNAICKKNISEVPKTLNDHKLDAGARSYLASHLELEWAMKYLLDCLEEADKLDNTLIVLVGDHYPYYLSDASAKSLLGYLPDSDFERYHSTCIMWYNSEEPIICDTPCCNVDILPTVLNLMNIQYDSRLISGTDIFSDSLHVAMLYNKNFITDTVKYKASNGKATWLIDTEGLDKDELKAYTDNVYSILKGRYAAALSINKLDFYRFVWKNSDIPSRKAADAATDLTDANAVPIATGPADEVETPPDTDPVLSIEEATKQFYSLWG